MERYSRQSAFSHIGREGQEKLLRSKVVVIGVGALGTVAANNLARAGLGYIRMIDRDCVELVNLHRQVLYDEDDAAQSLPKAIAAYNRLKRVNSEITLEPVIADVGASNIEGLISDMDLVLDATDNFQVRMVINEACFKHRIPWIYCGALESLGTTMNILPDGDSPCLKCYFGESIPSSTETCRTVGVLNMLTVTMASIQTAEAVKILLDSDSVRRELLFVDLWENRFDMIKIEKDKNCPVCARHEYEYLSSE